MHCCRINALRRLGENTMNFGMNGVGVYFGVVWWNGYMKFISFYGSKAWYFDIYCVVCMIRESTDDLEGVTVFWVNGISDGIY